MKALTKSKSPNSKGIKLFHFSNSSLSRGKQKIDFNFPSLVFLVLQLGYRHLFGIFKNFNAKIYSLF